MDTLKAITARENGKKGGRPVASHTLEAAKGRERIVELVTARTDELVGWLFKKAYQVDDKGKEIIDPIAIKELLDRGYGKAAQSIDLHAKIEPVIPSNPELLRLAQEYESKIKEGLSNDIRETELVSLDTE